MAFATIVYLIIGAVVIAGVFWVLRNNLQTSSGSGTASRMTRSQPSGSKAATKVKNPYRATSIISGIHSCAKAAALDGKRFLINDVPQLPLTSCDAAKCDCKYAHHEDRRDEGGSRRSPASSLATTMYHHKAPERREQRGRRASDWEKDSV